MNIQIIKNKSQKIRTRRKKYNKQNIKFPIIMCLCIFLIIGILIGTVYFKNIANNNFFEENINVLENIDFANKDNINNKKLFTGIILKNIVLLIFIWIIGLSILGIPLLIFIVLYDGFSLGVTISYILNTFGFYKGYTFIYSSMYLTTLINTAAMILLCNSAVKVTTNILKQKTNIKSEFIRHSLVCTLILILLIFSSIIEFFTAKYI